MNYKLGINLDLGFDATESQILSSAKQAGFEAFFTLWRRGRSELCRQLAQQALQEGMIFQSIHVCWDRIESLWADDEYTQDVVDYHIECIHLCRELNVPIMVLHVFAGFGVDYIPTESGLESVGKIVREAERCNVRLAFENTEGEPYLAAILERYASSPCVGYCWDTGHEQCYNSGRPMPELYGNGKVFATHFNDSLGITGTEITWLDDAHLLPYDGIIDWSMTMRRLEQSGYREEILTFELTRKNKPDRHTHDAYASCSLDEFLKQAYECAKRVAAE